MFLMKLKEKSEQSKRSGSGTHNCDETEWTESQAKIQVADGIRKCYNETRKAMTELKYMF